MKLLLGLDIGGTKSAVLAGTAEGEVLQRREWLSHASRGPEAMIAELLAGARELQSLYPTISSFGCSIGGPLDAQRGIIYSPPNLPGWDALPLRERLEKALGLPGAVEHDAAACALAEYYWGAGQKATHLIYLTCGTGFGMGLIQEGRPYRGAGGRSMEVGHVPLRGEGPVGFGKAGSAEGFCAGGSLGRLAQWLYPTRWPQPPEARDLVALADQGDPEARDVLWQNADATGQVCAWLGDMLRPDRILLGSLARYLGSEWVGWVESRFARETLAETRENCQILPAGLAERLQDCSALAVARNATGG